MLLTLCLLPLQNLLNRYWRHDEENFSQLTKLAGKSLAIEILGINLTLYLVVNPRGIQFSQNLGYEADAQVQGMPFSLASLLLSKAPLSKIRQGDVRIEGDLEFVQQLQHWLSNTQIDWQEQLTPYLGDYLTCQLGEQIEDIKTWHQEARVVLGQNLIEYLQEESKAFPPREEVTDFTDEVYQLRLASDRLEARWTRLAQFLKDGA